MNVRILLAYGNILAELPVFSLWHIYAIWSNAGNRDMLESENLLTGRMEYAIRKDRNRKL